MAALSWDDLYAVWSSTTDTAFVQSLETAGDGRGLETYGQMITQMARVSLAIAKTTQSLYILPHSGQDQIPGSGGALSTVTLTVTRTSGFEKPLTLMAGAVWIEEVTREWGDDPGFEGQDIPTGRRYTPVADVTLSAGSASASFAAIAEFPGSSYNNPLPDTISLVQEFSETIGFYGTTVPGASEWLIDELSSPTMLGAYVRFVSGPNAGLERLIVGYSNGRMLLQPGTTALAADSNVSWQIVQWSDYGLVCTHALSPAGGCIGMLDALGSERKVLRYANEVDDDYRDRIATMIDVVSPNAIRRCIVRALKPYGLSSNGIREAGTSTLPGIFADVPGNVGCCYDNDAVTVTSSMGGAPTGFQEGEWVYQVGTDGEIATGRVAFLNGVFDAISGVRGTFTLGLSIVGRTTGASFVPGTLGSGLRTVDQFRYAFDLVEMRGFFGVVIPQTSAGEFGAFYDDYPGCAADWSFVDGYPVTQVNANMAVWGAVDAARAAGVAFDIFQN